MSEVTELPDVLTIPEACKLLRISEPTLRRETRLGNIPVIRFGKRKMYNRLQLLKLGKCEQKEN